MTAQSTSSETDTSPGAVLAQPGQEGERRAGNDALPPGCGRGLYFPIRQDHPYARRRRWKPGNSCLTQLPLLLSFAFKPGPLRFTRRLRRRQR